MKFKYLSLIVVAGTMAITSCKKDDPIEDTQPPVSTDPSVTYTGDITSNMTWTKDSVRILDKKVVVRSGATLTIMPGTIIKGKEGIETLASALVIERGGYLIAEGTAAEPIVFTSILDNIALGQKTGTNLDENDNGKWGGLIVLGNAPVSVDGSDITGQIEGIPATEAYGTFGGNNAADSSGVLKYISVRHGGALIGNGNEINGITLGGVGNKTVISHVEVVGNLDDGIECFGGTVNISHAIVSFQNDDAIDLDQNYSGTFNNVMILQKTGSDEAFEIDGPEGSTYTSGLFTINNATAKSIDGGGYAGDLKSKAQGTLNNVLWQGYTNWVKVRESYDENNACADKTDAYDRAINGTLKITNSTFFGATSVNDAITAYTDNTSCSASLTSGHQVGLDAVLSPTNSTNGTTGANSAEFTGWSWASIKGKI